MTITRYWIGGSPCAGKSSISNQLACQFGLAIYHVDDHFARHCQQLDPVHHPALTHWNTSTWDERWMRPVDQLLGEVIACYDEHFSLLLEDLARIEEGKPLLIEGSALLPRRVADLQVAAERAIWIVPTADFQRQHYSQREWVNGILAQCDDPQRAFDNRMNRDADFAKWVSDEASKLGYSVLVVDGSQSLAANTEQVAKHFRFA